MEFQESYYRKFYPCFLDLRIPRDWCLAYKLQIKTFQERGWLMHSVVGVCSSRVWRGQVCDPISQAKCVLLA